MKEKVEITQCIRCDEEVSMAMGHGLTLTYNQETGAVKVCDECEEVVKRRDFWQ